MAIRFENGIVVTLGKKNRVLWNETVVSEGERVAAIGRTRSRETSFRGLLPLWYALLREKAGKRVPRPLNSPATPYLLTLIGR